MSCWPGTSFRMSGDRRHDAPSPITTMNRRLGRNASPILTVPPPRSRVHSRDRGTVDVLASAPGSARSMSPSMTALRSAIIMTSGKVIASRSSPLPHVVTAARLSMTDQHPDNDRSCPAGSHIRALPAHRKGLVLNSMAPSTTDGVPTDRAGASGSWTSTTGLGTDELTR